MWRQVTSIMITAFFVQLASVTSFTQLLRSIIAFLLVYYSTIITGKSCWQNHFENVITLDPRFSEPNAAGTGSDNQGRIQGALIPN